MDINSLSIHWLRENYSDEDIKKLLMSLSPAEAEELQYNWKFWARPEQILPTWKWRYALALCGRSWGKGHTNSTPILTTKGWSTMGDLQQGDYVFDEKGLPTLVSGVYPQGKKQVWRFEFSDQTYIDCEEDHLWTTWSAKDVRLYRKHPERTFPPKDWASFEETVYDCNGEPQGTYGCQTNAAKDLLGRLTQGHLIPVAPPLKLEGSKLPCDPYLLGVWVATSVPKGPISSEYLLASEADRLSLLQGLMDISGRASGYHLTFASISSFARDAVEWLARSLGNQTLRVDSSDCFGVAWCAHDKEHIPFRFESKRRTLTAVSKSSNCRLLSAIEVLPYEEWITCIRVESPNSLFLVGHQLIPSHNTRTGAEWVVERARQGKGPIHLIGQTAGDVRDVMVEAGPSSIIEISAPNFMPLYEPSKRRVTWPNGVYASLFSGDEPGQLRGPQCQTAWVDELPKFDDPSGLMDQVEMGLRIGDSRCLITTTPTPHPIIKEYYLLAKSKAKLPSNARKVYLIEGSTFDNSANIDADFLASVKEKYKGTRMEKQELYGKIIWESEKALWKQSDIDKFRVESAPPAKLSAIAVDPTVGDPNKGKKKGHKRNIDDCGIVTGERGIDEHGYFTGDYTIKGTPATWAGKVRALWETGEYDFIVAEVNNGGLLVQEVLTARGIPEHAIKLVSASHGKLIRAEPISLRSEQGKIHHVGEYEKLEEELVTYEGTGNSPNRLDAFVWLFTFLLPVKTSVVKIRKGIFKRYRASGASRRRLPDRALPRYGSRSKTLW